MLGAGSTALALTGAGPRSKFDAPVVQPLIAFISRARWEWRAGGSRAAGRGRRATVLGFLDFQRKVGGLGAVFCPSGNIDLDMVEIRKFYPPLTGKNPLQQ